MIRRLNFLLSIWGVSLALASCNGQDGVTDAEYTITAGASFKISLPCNPEVDTTSYQIHPAVGLECQDGTDVYTIRGVKYASNLYSSDSVANLDFDLDYSQLAYTETGELKVLNAFPRSVKGYPGKEFRYEYLTEDKVRFSRVYIVKNTLYELAYEGVKSDAYHNKIDAFFDSFTPTSIEDNYPPYLEVPSLDKLGDLPYKIEFPGETEKRVEVQESFFGKSTVFMEAQQSKVPAIDGYLVLMISYVSLPEGMSETDRERILTEQKSLLETGQIDSRLIKDFPTQNGHEYIAEYSLAGKKVVDRRRAYLYGDSYLLVVSMRVADTPENDVIRSFFDSVEVYE